MVDEFQQSLYHFVGALVGELVVESRMDSVSLDSYRVLDSPPEAHFDRITAAAARILGVPFAILSFLDGDGEWVKSAYGCAPGRVAIHRAPAVRGRSDCLAAEGRRQAAAG